MRIAVRLKPGARHDSILGWQDDPQARADDAAVLAISVTAPARDGKANKALIRVVADALALPRSAVRIVRGETSRLKQLELPDDTDLRSLAVPCPPARPPGSDPTSAR